MWLKRSFMLAKHHMSVLQKTSLFSVKSSYLVTDLILSSYRLTQFHLMAVMHWMSPFLIWYIFWSGAALVLQPTVDGKKEESVAGECGRMNANWVSHRAVNCTDSSKHDAISASHCYSLSPNTIRLSNTTIMWGARLTLSSTCSILCLGFHSHMFLFHAICTSLKIPCMYSLCLNIKLELFNSAPITISSVHLDLWFRE